MATFSEALTVASPLVSVILPTYNRMTLLGRAIQSVLGQTYRNLELIVVNDASTDDTAKVVESFNDSRLRYISLERNRHVSAARNIGIRAANGELLAFQDDDDCWLVDKLQKQVTILMNAPEGVGLNLCGHICLTKKKVPLYIGGLWYFRNVQPENGFTNMALIATPGWLVRKQLLERVGLFDERMKTFEDWELSLRLSEVCKFSHLNEPLFIQDHSSSGGLWENEKLYAGAMQIVMARHADKWQHDSHILSSHYYIIGKAECMYHSVLDGRRWLRKALALSPLHIKVWGVLAASYLGRDFIPKLRVFRGALRALLLGRK